MVRLCCILFCASCAPRAFESSMVADRVVDSPPIEDGLFRDPSAAANGVFGGGDSAGSLDVYSMVAGDVLVLGFPTPTAPDGDGAELVVFENAFLFAGGVFMDPVFVEVSTDGDSWASFAPDYIAEDETIYEAVPDAWVGFAGTQPVRLHESSNPVDPLGPEAGGNPFDLADAVGPNADAARLQGVSFVRLTPVIGTLNPDTGEPFPMDPIANGPDIDGVYGRRPE